MNDPDKMHTGGRAVPSGGFADAASDIPAGNWVDKLLPGWVRPFARLARWDRPIGTWLLLFPCWWSVTMAAGGLDVWHLIAFGLGALLMRGAGCTINDILDRKLDAEVARTRTRPIPAGDVGVTAATIFFLLQTAVGGAILLSFNRVAIAVGLASLILILVYPLMKRITHWPQFVLGLAFNWGALLGWAAVTGEIGLPAILLYLGGICWTLGYDTIYAHQDRPDDPAAGVKSTALVLGNKSKPWLYGFYLSAAALFGWAGAEVGISWVYFLALAAGSAPLFWQVYDVDLDDARDCLAKFKSNRLFGWLLLAGIMGAGLLAE